MEGKETNTEEGTGPRGQVIAKNRMKKVGKEWRAKLYQLNTEGGWDDMGTGQCGIFVTVEEEEDELFQRDGVMENIHYIKLTSESDGIELLNSKITMKLDYHRQRDTIITWFDSLDTNMDLAISFQDLDGAKETWNILCNIQGKDPDEISADELTEEEMLPQPNPDTF